MDRFNTIEAKDLRRLWAAIEGRQRRQRRLEMENWFKHTWVGSLTFVFGFYLLAVMGLVLIVSVLRLMRGGG